MPNHTETIIKVKGKLSDITTLLQKHVSFNETKDKCHLDFNTIIPQPETPAECPARYLITSEADAREHSLAWDPTNPRNWFNWYDWQLEHWGTKWNSYDCSIPDPDAIADDLEVDPNLITDIEMVVYTAWAPATPVYEKLQEMYPDLEITVYYLDEGWFYAGILWADGHIDETNNLDVKEPDDIFNEVMTVLSGYDWQERYGNEDEEC
jgi:hypothetical protein